GENIKTHIILKKILNNKISGSKNIGREPSGGATGPRGEQGVGLLRADPPKQKFFFFTKGLHQAGPKEN
ncbi:hypothetical protein KJ032_27010, partial [Salmonella enterica subsp. enterica serovar Typhimurium]|nr:hypothetical protein [Salmonella enterica subsp. enterica serovar Typhimurium]